MQHLACKLGTSRWLLEALYRNSLAVHWQTNRSHTLINAAYHCIACTAFLRRPYLPNCSAAVRHQPDCLSRVDFNIENLMMCLNLVGEAGEEKWSG
jgi:hypothetical protein